MHFRAILILTNVASKKKRKYYHESSFLSASHL
jgi:hypothetical protein